MGKKHKPVYDPIAQQKAMARATVGTPPPSKLVPDKHKLRELLPKHKTPDWKRGNDFE